MLSSSIAFFLFISLITLTTSDFSMHIVIHIYQLLLLNINFFLLLRLIEFSYALFPHVENFLVIHDDCTIFILYSVSFCSFVLCPFHIFGRLEHQV
uniref:Putative product n=1 Tax=Xenopsylla cheopis TaxID=163159 RepID=A0A6M2E2B2_XENCH